MTTQQYNSAELGCQRRIQWCPCEPQPSCLRRIPQEVALHLARPRARNTLLMGTHTRPQRALLPGRVPLAALWPVCKQTPIGRQRWSLDPVLELLASAQNGGMLTDRLSGHFCVGGAGNGPAQSAGVAQCQQRL